MHTRVVCVKEIDYLDFKFGEMYTRLRIYEGGKYCFIKECKTSFTPMNIFMTMEEFREKQLNSILL